MENNKDDYLEKLAEYHDFFAAVQIANGYQKMIDFILGENE